jgi:hypothetical protein
VFVHELSKKDLTSYLTKSRRTASNKTYRVNSLLATRNLKLIGTGKIVGKLRNTQTNSRRFIPTRSHRGSSSPATPFRNCGEDEVHPRSQTITRGEQNRKIS